MNRRRTSLLLAAAVVAGGATAIVPATVSSAQKAITVRKFSVAIASDPRSMGDGRTWTFRNGRRGHAMYSMSNPRKIELGFGDDEVGGRLEFVAPHEKRLKPGFYQWAQNYPFQDPSAPGISLTWDTACSNSGGWFDIDRIRFSERGRLKRLAMTFGHHCDGSIHSFNGEIRIGPGAHRKDAVVLPERPLWVPIEVGSESWETRMYVVPLRRNVTLEGIGTHGPHRGDFVFDSHGCSEGETLRRRGCTARVRFAPETGGPRTAALRVRAGGRQRAILEGLALASRSTLTMTKEPGPAGGEPKSWSFSTVRGDFFRGWRIADRGLETEVITAEDDHWYLAFSSTAGLLPGRRYEVPGAGDEVNYMSISGDGGCSQETGWFTVDDFGFRRNGYGHYLDLDFEHHCDNADAALTGSYEFRVPTGETVEPAAVKGLRVRRNGTRAKVTWKASSSGDVAYYFVRYAVARRVQDTMSGYPGYAGSRTSATLRGLPRRGKLRVAVYVVDQAGNIGGPTTLRGR